MITHNNSVDTTEQQSYHTEFRICAELGDMDYQETKWMRLDDPQYTPQKVSNFVLKLESWGYTVWPEYR